MKSKPRLLAIFAHPDDESLGNGGMLAKYAAEGVETYLITATRGERGWFGPPEEYPGSIALGRTREAELRDAAEILGIQRVTFLDYVDGEVDKADPGDVIARLVAEIRRLRPHVVVTFDEWGIYGHPDHMAISRFTSQAVFDAARAERPELGPPHAVDSLYYMAWTQQTLDVHEKAFGEITMEVDGELRRPRAWAGEDVSARIDASGYWQTAWRAIACHRSQLPGYESVLKLPESYHRSLWANLTYFRAMGRAAFEGGVTGTLFDSRTPAVAVSTAWQCQKRPLII